MANKIGEGQWQGLDGKIYSSEGEANTQMGNVVLDNTGSSSFSSYSKAPDIVDKYRAEKAAEDKAKLAAESAALGAAASLEIKQRFAEAEKIVEQGRELCLKGAFDEAIATLNRTINGKNIAVESSAFAWRGRCYFEKGDYAKAFDDINTVIFALSPNALKEHHLFAPERNLIPSIFVMRAFLYEKKGDNNKAIADFKTAANWDWYNQATSREHGYEYADDNIQALKALKNRGVEYTPQLPQIPKEWEQYRPKASSFSKYSTANIGVSDAKKAAEYIEIVMKTYENDPNKAIEYANKVIEIGGEYLADAYSFRATSYLVLGQQDKAIDSFKLAADYGDENSIQILGKIGVNYTPTPRKAQKTLSSGSSTLKQQISPQHQSVSSTPQQQSSSSSSNSSSSSSSSSSGGISDIFLKLGFENADTGILGLNGFLSFLLGAVITAGALYLANMFISGTELIIYGIAVFVLAFSSLKWTNKILIVVLSIIAAIGIGFFVYNNFILS